MPSQEELRAQVAAGGSNVSSIPRPETEDKDKPLRNLAMFLSQGFSMPKPTLTESVGESAEAFVDVGLPEATSYAAGVGEAASDFLGNLLSRESINRRRQLHAQRFPGAEGVHLTEISPMIKTMDSVLKHAGNIIQDVNLDKEYWEEYAQASRMQDNPYFNTPLFEGGGDLGNKAGWWMYQVATGAPTMIPPAIAAIGTAVMTGGTAAPLSAALLTAGSMEAANVYNETLSTTGDRFAATEAGAKMMAASVILNALPFHQYGKIFTSGLLKNGLSKRLMNDVLLATAGESFAEVGEEIASGYLTNADNVLTNAIQVLPAAAGIGLLTGGLGFGGGIMTGAAQRARARQLEKVTEGSAKLQIDRAMDMIDKGNNQAAGQILDSVEQGIDSGVIEGKQKLEEEVEREVVSSIEETLEKSQKATDEAVKVAEEELATQQEEQQQAEEALQERAAEVTETITPAFTERPESVQDVMTQVEQINEARGEGEVSLTEEAIVEDAKSGLFMDDILNKYREAGYTDLQIASQFQSLEDDAATALETELGADYERFDDWANDTVVDELVTEEDVAEAPDVVEEEPEVEGDYEIPEEPMGVVKDLFEGTVGENPFTAFNEYTELNKAVNAIRRGDKASDEQVEFLNTLNEEQTKQAMLGATILEDPKATLDNLGVAVKEEPLVKVERKPIKKKKVSNAERRRAASQEKVKKSVEETYDEETAVVRMELHAAGITDTQINEILKTIPADQHLETLEFFRDNPEMMPESVGSIRETNVNTEEIVEADAELMEKRMTKKPKTSKTKYQEAKTRVKKNSAALGTILKGDRGFADFFGEKTDDTLVEIGLEMMEDLSTIVQYHWERQVLKSYENFKEFVGKIGEFPEWMVDSVYKFVRNGERAREVDNKKEFDRTLGNLAKQREENFRKEFPSFDPLVGVHPFDTYFALVELNGDLGVLSKDSLEVFIEKYKQFGREMTLPVEFKFYFPAKTEKEFAALFKMLQTLWPDQYIRSMDTRLEDSLELINKYFPSTTVQEAEATQALERINEREELIGAVDNAKVREAAKKLSEEYPALAEAAEKFAKDPMQKARLILTDVVSKQVRGAQSALIDFQTRTDGVNLNDVNPEALIEQANIIEAELIELHQFVKNFKKHGDVAYNMMRRYNGEAVANNTKAMLEQYEEITGQEPRQEAKQACSFILSEMKF